jgi:ABC-type uncharacterized transport system involved in gliding motility auxiliary subunit
MMSRNSRLSLFLVFVAVIFFSVNVIAQAVFRSSHMDLTADKLFTLSDGTKEIVRSLPDTITLRFYFSKKLATEFPATEEYAKRVRDMLEEYRRLSNGKVDLEVIDPEPFSDAEDDAVAQGLNGIPTGNGDQIYFGLVGTDRTDRKQVIPVFDQSREQTLEYDLTGLVQTLGQASKPKIAVLSALPLAYGPGGIQASLQGQSQPYTIWQQLTKSFDVASLPQDFKEIPPQTDVLLIADPAKLDDHELFAIDQFVLKGGRVLAFLDPYVESAAYTQSANGQPVPTSSTLGPLLKAWGVSFDTTQVVADRSLAQPVRMRSGSPVPIDYVVWLRPGAANMNRTDLVTTDLDNLLLASPGFFTKADGATLDFQPLVTSSDQSELIPSTDMATMPSPDDLLRDFKPTGETYVLAARITGMAKTAFPDGPPKLESKTTSSVGIVEEENLPAGDLVTESKQPINVVLVADADLLDDRFWVQTQQVLGQTVAIPTADNGAFVMNAVENLSGSAALISLRSRGTSARPFVVVDRLRREAEQQYLAEEQRLQQQLDRTQQQISEMQQQRGDGGLFATPQQQEAINAYRQQEIATRKQLREVQRHLRQSIDTLAGRLRIINIVLMPLLVAVLAIGLGMARKRRYRKSRRRA